MGVFGGLSSAVKSVAGSLGGGGALTLFNPAAALTAGTIGLNAAGSIYQANQNKSSAKDQMRFQREMSNTAYRRVMNDLEKAGLNPILAAKIGGASTPQGAGYQTPNIGESATAGAHSAVNLMQQVATTRNIQTQNQVLQKDAQRAGIENAILEQYPSVAVSQMLKGVSLPVLGVIEYLMKSGKITNAKDAGSVSIPTIEIKGDKNSKWDPHGEKKKNRLSKEENDQINDAWQKGDVYNATEWW